MNKSITAMLFRPFRHEPWPAPPMPSLREHLESYGGIGKSAVEVRGMVDEALKEIGKHSVHELEQKYFLDVDGKVIGWGASPAQSDGYATCATIARGIPTTKSSCSEEDSVPDERIEKAAIAIFAAQTNWEEPNPTQKTVKALWDGQMDAVRDSFRRLAKAALDSLEDRPADLDWENAEPKELDNRLVEAVTKGGTIVRGRTVAVQGSLDQLIVEGVLQPLLIRFPGEHWRLANGWKTLNFYKREADSGLHRP